MKRKLLLAVPAVAVLATAGTLVATHVGRSGGSTLVLGQLRVITASADLTPAGPITSDQALGIVTTKLGSLEPGVNWTSTGLPPQVTLISNMTQVYDSTTGHLLYTRSTPINAWIVQIHQGRDFGFGIVSDNTAARCTGYSCDPPGTSLNVQALVVP